MSKINTASLPCLFVEKTPFEEYKKSGGIQSAQLSDGQTNYELSGDLSSDHLVVLLHGGTIPLCIWEPQMEAFRTAGFKVLRYDQYGKGFSARCKGVHGRDLFKRQLTELLDFLKITSPVSIIGPSFGGSVAINFAASYPKRVRTLILVSPALNLLNSKSPLTGPIKLLQKPIIGELLFSLLFRKVIVERGRKLIAGGIGSPCDTTFVRQFSCKGTRRALLSQFRSDAYGDYRERTRTAGESDIPVLLIRGTDDAEITDVMIQEVKSDLPNCRFEEFEHSGHGAPIDAPDKFNVMAIDFLKSH